MGVWNAVHGALTCDANVARLARVMCAELSASHHVVGRVVGLGAYLAGQSMAADQFPGAGRRMGGRGGMGELGWKA